MLLQLSDQLENPANEDRYRQLKGKDLSPEEMQVSYLCLGPQWGVPARWGLKLRYASRAGEDHAARGPVEPEEGAGSSLAYPPTPALGTVRQCAVLTYACPTLTYLFPTRRPALTYACATQCP
eukprot:3731430-Rhodomonas_salina.3